MMENRHEKEHDQQTELGNTDDVASQRNNITTGMEKIYTQLVLGNIYARVGLEERLHHG